ncbi:PREDICTED: uncharacterized protein LOC105555750 [Vollenhovia emeryi]|uniref:uncharacterized protein LOC105555750 n=1 Tax=Vollenhovia emeryi TaxID=411798 RepID=UPI0005F532AE|nr:PREDICTED: uncharacterized protein LOC105555750 [Vollenhovia emeryi]
MKRHLKRTIGSASLTVSEMVTVLSQIEAIMNSRPITPLSEDRLTYRTYQFHGYQGGNMLSKSGRGSGRDGQSIHLTTCQQRSKWRTARQETVQVGQLVMLNEDEAMPCKWTMARIMDIHPGEDGVVRAVTVRTAKGQCKRPMVKLAPIPID